MDKKGRRLLFIAAALIVLTLACISSGQTGLDSSALKGTELSLKETELALGAEKLTAESNLLATSAAVAAFTPTVEIPQATNTPEQLAQPTVSVPTPTHTMTLQPTSSKVIIQVSTDRKTFYCVPSDGPTTLTITVQLNNVDNGVAVWWRLQEKTGGKTTDWEFKDMRRAGGNNRDFTFDADTWNGTNNFYYPPLMGESWFQYQIIADGNVDRTEVFSDVTFFPCAQ